MSRTRARPPSEQDFENRALTLEAIITSAMDAIISVNEHQKIVLFNPAAERMFGCPVREAMGTSLDRFIPIRFREVHQNHIRRFDETGVTSRSMRTPGVLTAVREDGSEFPIEATISQVQSAAQKSLQSLSVTSRNGKRRRKNCGGTRR